jgi:RimJ/RimL family protein N-acetyltransferase
MNQPQLHAREIEPRDVPLAADYWLKYPAAYYIAMGVDMAKLPSREIFEAAILKSIATPLEQRGGLSTVWEVDGVASGHCAVNKLVPGECASMHLHLWNSEIRMKGLGTQLVKLSLNIFFEKLNLKYIYCEPHSENLSPNRTLGRVGFHLVKQYTPEAGPISYQHEVNRWEMTRAQWMEMRGNP